MMRRISDKSVSILLSVAVVALLIKNIVAQSPEDEFSAIIGKIDKYMTALTG